MAILDSKALDDDGLDETFLRQSIERNDTSGIAYAANVYNFDMNFFPNSSESPLCLACKLGFLEAAKELVWWGAKIDIHPDEEPTPLILAAENGHIEIVNWLVEAGVDVNYSYELVDSFGDIEWKATALTEAIINNHIDIASFLLKYGASPLEEGFRKESSIQHFFGCDSETVQPVLFCIKNKLFTLLEQMMTVVNNNVDISTVIDGDTYTPLTYSIYTDNYVAAEMVIRAGADINDDTKGIAAIDIAITTKKIEYVKLLLNNGIDLLKIDCENEFVFEKICIHFPDLSDNIIRNMAVQLHKLYNENEKYFETP